MATTKKNSYISTELDWAEVQLESWKAYIDANPIDKLQHDIQWKTTKTGGAMPMVIASIQQQIKCIQDTMTRYLQLLEVVDKLREKEEEKLELRGKSTMSSQAEQWLKHRT